mmetsp:Transcript_3032/g.8289  ORF Transcript_3032/g.8289 Transcript_3032/m.8289 type:complete len:90 (+) Transcript_3032:625-894(+)
MNLTTRRKASKDMGKNAMHVHMFMFMSSSMRHANAVFRSPCRTCVDLLVDLLVSRDRVDGEEIRQVVEGAAAPEDLRERAQAAQESALL